MILKPCPFCAKSIPRAIKVCPYCHLDEQGQLVPIDSAMDEVEVATGKAFHNDLDAFSSPDPFKREQAVMRMSMRGFGVVKPLLTILSENTRPGLPAIAKVLGRIRDRRAIPVLTQAANIGDEELRMTALWALAQFREPEALAALLREAERPDPTTQSYLTYVLGSYQDSSVIPVLERLTRHSNREVAFQAVYALGQVGNRQAIATLRMAARQSEPVIRLAALASMRRLGVSPASPQRLLFYGIGFLVIVAIILAGLWIWRHGL